MSESMLILITFIIALFVGIFFGKLLFTAQSKSEKSGLEERINGYLNQIEQLKIQMNQLVSEKETVQKEKESLRSSFIDCLNKAIASLGDFF